jgi:hypothetical protein
MARDPKEPQSTTPSEGGLQSAGIEGFFARNPQLTSDLTRETITSQTIVRPYVPSAESKLAEQPKLPGTTTLDYVGLGLLLAPPTVVLDMYLKGADINWRKLAIATGVSWIAGGIAVWASHQWKDWRRFVPRLLPYLATFESKFWGKAIIIAGAMGFALTLSSVLSTNQVSPSRRVGTFAETYTFTYADAHKIRDEVFKIRDLLPPGMDIWAAYDSDARNVADGIFGGASLAGVSMRTVMRVSPLTPQETGISIRVGDLSKIPNSARALAGAIKNALGVEPTYTAMQGLQADQFYLFVGTNPHEH